MAKRSFFVEAAPVDDPLVVLDLLYRRWGDGTTRSLLLDPRCLNGWEAYVEIATHWDFLPSWYERFRVTKRVAAELLERLLVQGTPHWGYTDLKELRISDAGCIVLHTKREAAGLDHQLSAANWLRGHL